MFEEFLGIPAHPLLVHAAVVFVPLLALLTVAYVFAPFVRPHTRWVLAALALMAPLSALLAKLSGDAFFDRMDDRGAITEGFYSTIENHQQLGNFTLVSTAGLGVVTLIFVYLVGPRGGTGKQRVGSLVVGALCVVAAAVSLYFVVRTGDSGSKAVWTGR